MLGSNTHTHAKRESQVHATSTVLADTRHRLAFEFSYPQNFNVFHLFTKRKPYNKYIIEELFLFAVDTR